MPEAEIYMEIHFSPSFAFCPKCGFKLLFFRRSVKSLFGAFSAKVEKKHCQGHGIFGSKLIEKVVSAHCTYANDVMIESASQMFLGEKLL